MLPDPSFLEVALLVLAATGAGAINALVGSGTLLTFPTLLALGLPPVAANVTNNVGLVFGSVTGTWGYRRELSGQGARLIRLLPASAAGGLLGAGLLLVLPESVFEAAVPALVAVGLALVALQPWLSRRSAAAVERHLAAGGTASWGPVSRSAAVGLLVGVFAAGVYGGYFGAAQGVILIGVLGASLADDLQRVNAVKNVLAATVNLLASVLFLTVAADQVDWFAAAVIAVGSAIGGFLGARYGRRLPSVALRGVIVVVGVVAITALIVT